MIDMEMGKLQYQYSTVSVSVTIMRYQRSFVELDQLYTIEIWNLVVDAPHKLIRFIPSTGCLFTGPTLKALSMELVPPNEEIDWFRHKVLSMELGSPKKRK